MKNLCIILAAFVAFSVQSFATESFAAQCVPTKTVEQAKADYDSSIAALNVSIHNTYSKAVNDYNVATAANLAAYDQQVVAINAAYNAQVKLITDNLAPGWQDALKAATDKHNQDLDLAIVQVDVKNKNEYAVYNQTVNQAKANFTVRAQAIADVYNKAVCAQ
ncbi:MAG: hypothetical protein H7256_01085 [Bdellovibrio sp.]|nr:hypothetical protein [Bdellovibrio sp.]